MCNQLNTKALTVSQKKKSKDQRLKTTVKGISMTSGNEVNLHAIHYEILYLA
jgi:hypothetical protein